MNSQNNEEQIILDYFGDYIGTFLDLGANDGQTLSNSRALALKGWHGVLVEPAEIPNQKACELYRDNQNIQVLKVAIGETDGVVSFWDMGEHLGNGDTSLLSTAVETELDRWHGVDFEKTTVQMVTIKTLLSQTRLKEFDFVTVDCEGLDLIILKQLDLSKIRLLCIEYNGGEIEPFTEIMKGFRLIAKNPENLIFGR